MAPAPKYSPKEQEEIILNAAAECIEQSSLLDFTMSAISKAACLSMGSIYKHVQCKEDIIFALAMRMFKQQSNIFHQIMAMPLTTPEKIIAIALIDPVKTQVYSFDRHLEFHAANELVISKASAAWTERMLAANAECEQLFNKNMHQAAFSGELTLNGNTEQIIEEINLGCWALMMGHKYVDRVIQIQGISEGTDTLQQSLATNALAVKSLQRLLNAYHWQTPLDDAGISKASEQLIAAKLR